MRAAVIDKKTGEVVNVIEYDPKAVWAPPKGHALLKNEHANIGDTWNGKKLVPKPQPPVALKVTRKATKKTTKKRR